MISNRTKEKTIEILKRNGVKKAAVFGSFARGAEKKSSDIDILVDAPDEMSLLGVVRLERELKEAAKRKVDLVTYDSIHPSLRDIILSEQKSIYG